MLESWLRPLRAGRPLPRSSARRLAARGRAKRRALMVGLLRTSRPGPTAPHPHPPAPNLDRPPPRTTHQRHTGGQLRRPSSAIMPGGQVCSGQPRRSALRRRGFCSSARPAATFQGWSATVGRLVLTPLVPPRPSIGLPFIEPCGVERHPQRCIPRVLGWWPKCGEKSGRPSPGARRGRRTLLGAKTRIPPWDEALATLWVEMGRACRTARSAGRQQDVCRSHDTAGVWWRRTLLSMLQRSGDADRAAVAVCWASGDATTRYTRMSTAAWERACCGAPRHKSATSGTGSGSALPPGSRAKHRGYVCHILDGS